MGWVLTQYGILTTAMCAQSAIESSKATTDAVYAVLVDRISNNIPFDLFHVQWVGRPLRHSRCGGADGCVAQRQRRGLRDGGVRASQHQCIHGVDICLPSDLSQRVFSARNNVVTIKAFCGLLAVGVSKLGADTSLHEMDMAADALAGKLSVDGGVSEASCSGLDEMLPESDRKRSRTPPICRFPLRSTSTRRWQDGGAQPVRS